MILLFTIWWIDWLIDFLIQDLSPQSKLELSDLISCSTDGPAAPLRQSRSDQTFDRSTKRS